MTALRLVTTDTDLADALTAFGQTITARERQTRILLATTRSTYLFRVEVAALRRLHERLIALESEVRREIDRPGLGSIIARHWYYHASGDRKLTAEDLDEIETALAGITPDHDALRQRVCDTAAALRRSGAALYRSWECACGGVSDDG